jgi:hypothetical protein
MDTNQARIIELLREVRLIAFKEIERRRQPLETPIVKRPTANMPTDHQPCTPKQPETGLLNEHEVAAYVNLSVASVRRWRLFRKASALGENEISEIKAGRYFTRHGVDRNPMTSRRWPQPAFRQTINLTSLDKVDAARDGLIRKKRKLVVEDEIIRTSIAFH